MNLTQQRQLVLNYLRAKNPVAFDTVVYSMSNGLGAVVSTGTINDPVTAAASEPSWFDRILQGLTAYGVIAQQRDINKLNLELIKQGKDPLSTDVTATAVNIGVSAETRKILMYTALGLGGLLLIMILRKKG